MKIGITYDLKQDYLDMGYGEEQAAEFDKPETVEAIEQCLEALGFKTERIGNIRHLTTRLAENHRWDMVFNIAEGMHGIGREAQVPALLDAYAIPYTFSDPMVLCLTLDKAMTKHVVRDLGVPTPDFRVVAAMSDLEGVSLPYPLFAKPIAEGTGKGIGRSSIIRNRQELESVCRDLLARFDQPVLVERFLPGREFTAGITGTGADARVIGVMEVLFLENAEVEAYSYTNKQEYKSVVKYRLETGQLAGQCEEVALSAWRGLRCRDAGRIDLRLDESGAPSFLEVNPLAGLNPIDSDLPILCNLVGMGYGKLIENIMESALKRTGLAKGAKQA